MEGFHPLKPAIIRELRFGKLDAAWVGCIKGILSDWRIFRPGLLLPSLPSQHSTKVPNNKNYSDNNSIITVFVYKMANPVYV